MVRDCAKATYADHQLSPVESGLRRQWFDPLPSGMSQVKKSLRDRVKARHLNLMDAWPMKKRFDVVFCRNVLIYFDQATCERLVNRFWKGLHPGGYLYIGHSESLSQIANRFEYIAPTIYRRPLDSDR